MITGAHGYSPFSGGHASLCSRHATDNDARYCHNGAMASAPSSRTDATAGSCGGSMMRTLGPPLRPLEGAALQETWAVAGGHAFGCANGLECLQRPSSTTGHGPSGHLDDTPPDA
jgi:hypothetical protein